MPVKTKDRGQGVAGLVAAVQALSQVHDIAGIREIVRHAARELTGADGATFVLRERDFCYYLDEDAIAPLWKEQRFSMDICVSGWAMQHRQPAVIEDAFADFDGNARDNGRGFDMADAERLFTPFHRLPSAAGIPGSGIGLATVKRIVRRHGGRIWASSAPGCGCTFSFTLPEPVAGSA